mgnify:CR=1 FL=1
MGSITFQVIGDVSVGTKTKAYTVSDADINRMVAAYKQGDQSMTVTAALLLWAADILGDTKRHVRDWENQVAFNGVTDISAS